MTVMNMKKFTSLLMLICILVSDVYARDVITGKCGADVTYTVNVKEKKLTLKGRGRLHDYTERTPWHRYIDGIEVLEIVGDIEAITGYRFSHLTSLKRIEAHDSKTYYAEGNCLITTDSVLCMGCATSVFPSYIKAIGHEAFYRCASLSSVDIPSFVEEIGAFAFYGCPSLSAVTIPASVNSIGKGAFRECTSLREVTIPESVLNVGMGAFSACTSLTFATVGAKKIGVAMFYGCTALSDVSILPSVEIIETGSFWGCMSLSKVSIPIELKSVGRVAFEGCTSLPSEGHVIYADKWAVGLDDKHQPNYVLRNNTVGISSELFSGCIHLQSVNIPVSVLAIGAKVFLGCLSVDSVSIGHSIASVDKSAFYGLTVDKIKGTVYDEKFLVSHGAYSPKTARHKSYASFPGGDKSLANFLTKNINKPEASTQDERKEVKVTFKVSADGTISDVKQDTASYDGVYKIILDELIRVTGIMPKWKPTVNAQGIAIADTASICVMFPYKDENDVLPIVTNASFPGGDEACMMWLQGNIKYPAVCQENGIQGRVTVSFIVGTDGAITEVEVVRSPDEHLSMEALRVVKSMPKWIPATYEGKPVRSRYNLPVMFRLG